jgi:quercetin dioxygenase-like cupin family protein
VGTIIQGKIWGSTSEVFNGNNVSVNRIEIKEGSCCSIHKHNHKSNIFFLESGSIKIQEWKNDYDLVDETTLGKGEANSVPPGNYHRFIGLEDSVVYEIYHVQLNSNDITRKDVGKEKYEGDNLRNNRSGR